MREALALLIPACAVGALIPSLSVCLGPPSRVSAAALALCLGIGFSSLTTTGLIVLGIAPGTGRFVLADAVIWAIVGLAGWWIRRRGLLEAPEITRRPAAARTLNRVDWIVRAAFGATAALALAAVAVRTQRPLRPTRLRITK